MKICVKEYVITYQRRIDQDRWGLVSLAYAECEHAINARCKRLKADPEVRNISVKIAPWTIN